ncbi:hypothetical protein [Cupriavidus sp. RAF12]|uniref:hypothetical protein n=1 Tax=Cupriavidus sp. RAF12 TaxID=3233050 RepID=UPI003F8E072A
MTPLQRRTTIDRILAIEVEVKSQEHGALEDLLHGGHIGFKNMNNDQLVIAANERELDILPTLEQERRLRQFAENGGHGWKDTLNSLWLNGRDASLQDGHLLRQVRNHLGPQWLKDVKLEELTA